MPATRISPADGTPAVQTVGLSHAYGSRPALSSLDLRIERGELFAVLGPNGGGKSTLFRLLSTLAPVQTGSAQVLGHDCLREQHLVRQKIGVVFQAPSLDRKLTVAENLDCQGALYGLAGAQLRERRDMLLAQFGLADRARDRVETLSGGLRRRLEVTKGLLHEPELLLMDEPTTGLDPAARSDLWRYLAELRTASDVTIVFTTHLLDEADAADRIAILNLGQLVALGNPAQLKAEISGDSITIETDKPQELMRGLAEKFSLEASLLDGVVRLEVPDGHQWIARLAEAFPGQIAALRVGKPTVEDVFIAKTGHRFWRETQETADG